MSFYIQWVKQGEKLGSDGEARRCKDKRELQHELEIWFQAVKDVIRETGSNSLVIQLMPFALIGLNDFSRPLRVFSVVSGYSPEHVVVYKDA